MVNRCEQCTRYYPAVTFKWDTGTISSPSVWDKLAADITHVDNKPFFTVTDTASGFTEWRALVSEASAEVVKCARSIFAEFGPPRVMMTDNGSVFRSREFKDVLENWNVGHILTCAYRPQGNGIAERVHRTVKRAVKRSCRSVEEAVFWVNNTRGERKLSPFELVFAASSRKPGVTTDRTEIIRPKQGNDKIDNEFMYLNCDRNPFLVGDLVYLRQPGSRCDTAWSGPHRVTDILSNVSVQLDADGIARHVSHLRLVPGYSSPENVSSVTFNEENDDFEVKLREGEDAPITKSENEFPSDSEITMNDSSENVASEQFHRNEELQTRSGRSIRPPKWLNDYEM